VGQRPNIIYILADDLGYGDVQALNPDRGKIQTPHLDRLASQGMTFTDAHSGSSVCTPTRYGLLTGRYAWRTRLQKGVLDGGNDEPLIAADRLTVPGLLKRHGYHTACIGKWHLGFIAEEQAERAAASKGRKAKSQRTGGAALGSIIVGGPTSRGFDYYFGCSNARTISSLIENDKVIERIEPVAMLPRLGSRAVDYIHEMTADAKSGQPFFLYLPLTSPHTPIVPAPQWQGKSDLGNYGDFVMQTDGVVGDVLAAVDRAGLTDKTLVIFSADNGCSPAAGTARLEQVGHFASERYRGYKADIWDGGHRVPFIVRWPSRISAGSKSSRLICHTDL
jgi:arylsulfatase A-like enzyme